MTGRGGIRILGAGVMGLTIAARLADAGHRVQLVDPAGSPGQGACSWWAGGMLAPYCEGESAPEPVERLGQGAAAWWGSHIGFGDARNPHGGLVHRRGTLVLTMVRDRAEMTRFARRARGHRMLDGNAIAALEPDLAGRFDTGLFFDSEAHLDPRRALTALRDRLAGQGISILPEASGPVGLTIDARGLAARDVLADLRGVRGEMAVLRCPDISLSRPVRLLHPRIPLYIVPRGQGVFMLGATMVESDRRGPASLRSVVELLSAAYALHPAFGEAEVLEIGADARPAFADNLPRLRRRGDLLLANGLYRHGFLLAPAVSAMVLDHLDRGTRPELMDEVST